MKAKKTKTHREENTSTTTTHHGNSAFSYLRNRLFHGTGTSNSSSSSSSSSSNGSSNQPSQQPPLPSRHETCQDAPSRLTGHSRSSSHRSSPSVDLAQLSNAWRSGSSTAGRPISRSFEEPQYCMDTNSQLTTSDATTMATTTTSFTRPMSVMGLLARHHDSSSSGRRAGEGKSESKRTSLIVIKEGFLYKKADFRAFHKASKLDRSWKPYRVVLRGHKLYLYKISSESAFKALFPSSSPHPQQQLYDLPSSPSSSSIASSIIKSVGDTIADPVELSISNMDQLGERDEYLYGAIFKEIKSAGESQHVALLLYKHEVVICARTSYQQQWKIDSRIPIDKVQLEQRVMDPQASSSFALLYKDELRIFTTHAADVQTSWIDTLMKTKEISCAGDKKRDNALYNELGPHPDLHMGEDQIVQGGTIEALVHELIFQQCTASVSDTFLRSFLLTYNMFTTSAIVLETMKSYLQQTMDDGDTQIMHNTFERILDLFTVWCNVFTQDVVGDVVAGMISILDMLEGALVDTPVLLDKTNITRELILATVNRNGEAGEQANVESAVSWDDAVESIQASQLGRSDINLSNLLITGLTPGLFLSIHPQRFAEQLYMFHLTQHRLHQDALISLLTYVPRPHISAQILNSVVFTAAAPHFIAKLIRHHILIDSQHHRQDGMEGNIIEENSTLLRTQLLEHWIRVGSSLLDLGDMTGWCAVASAICSLGVIRLKESWKSVDRSLVEMVTQDWVNRLMEYGFFTQEIWISGWEHSPILDKFTRVMDAPQQSSNDLAFFGPIRQSVDRLRKHIKDCYNEGGVNFAKYWMIYEAVQTSLDHWKRTMKPLPDNGYPFQVVGPLQAFFDHSVTTFISAPHDFKYLHECSLGCEPRIFGQSFDRHRKFDSLHGTNVAPPSSLTLTFPEVLEGYRLFQPPVEHLQHDTASSPRTNLRKKNSSHSVKSDSGEHGSSVTLPRTPTSLVSMSTSSTVATRPPPPTHGFSYDQSRQQKLPRVTRRKLFRRRTYSFPPGRAVGDTATRFMQSDDGATMDNSYLDSLHSRTWLGSLVSQKHGTSTAKALVEAIQHREKYSGEWLIVAENGNLILKASTLLQSDDSVTKKSPSPSLKKSTSSGFLALTEKGSSGMRSRSGTLSGDAPRKEEDVLLWGDNQQQEGQSVLVNVKAGLLEYLVDTLVHGVSAYNKDMREQWQLPSLLNGNLEETPRYLTIDEEEYTSAFFVTYRSFCSCVQLLDLMRKKFTGAVAASRQARQENRNALETVFKADNNNNQDFDWRFVASTQLRVTHLMLYWTEEHFYDFVDEIEILGHFSRFLEQTQAAIDEWTTPLRQQQQQGHSPKESKDIQSALSVAHAIHRQLNELRRQFIQKILSPCYDLKAISYDTTCSRKVDDLYTQLTTGMQRFSVAVTQSSRQSQAFSLISKPLEELGKETLSDQQSAWTLLEQTDRCVHQLFASVTLQDWIQTFDVFEAQSSDLYAWLPAHKASQTPPLSSSLSSVRDCPTAQPNSYHIAAEDVMVSDIFTAIEGARRSIVSPSAFSADDLLLAFPSSIQYLYCMHFIIRSLVIHETTAMDIDLTTRVQRIHKFLQMLMISKGVTEQMALFPELRDVDDRPRRVPGFVEYAIASALISPEVRVFTKAWSQVMRHYGLTQLDTLENLLSHIQQRNKVEDIYDDDSNTMRLVPSVGWIFDRMIELCAAVPDTYNRQQHMINFDKRRYVFHFLQLVMNSQMDLEEAGNNDASSNLAFIISPNQKKPTWKELKDMAYRENRAGGGLSTRAGSKGHYTRTTVFNKLVAEQLDKLKRDIKERDRIDKEWRDLQHKLQKRQLEQQRYLEKQERRNQQRQGHHHHHHLPKFNALFRNRKTGGGGHAESTSTTTMDASEVLATAKASTVINLIHATTSVASACTRRDHVFRVVTEEGGQYLFQGTSWDEMHDWMLQINNAAHAGAVKRRSVLAAESEDNRNSSGTTAAHHLTECDTPTSAYYTRRSVYGMDLSTLMADGNVPLIAEKCINEIEKRGLEEVGIYRMAGTGSTVEQLKAAFNRDMAAVDLSDPDWADVNVIADAFKQFIRSIPGSLLTHTYYDEFIHASASEDHDQRVYLIKQVLKKLPEPNYILLKRLIQHFVIVTDFEAVNHMYATNLAIVFGPTLLQPAPGPASFATTMSNLGHHQTIVKYLILHYHYLFDVESDEMEHEEGDDEEQHGDVSSTTTANQQLNDGDGNDDDGSKISTASNIGRDQ